MRVSMLPDAEVLANYIPEINGVVSGIVDTASVARIEVGFTDITDEAASIVSMLSQGILNARGQVSAEALLSTAQDARLCSPDSPAVILLSRDLAAEGTNFVFGFAIKEIGLVVQSLHRFAGERNRPAILRHIARHEIGHLLGLDERTIKSQDRRTGLFTGHCANDCTMQQYLTVSDAAKATKRLAGRSHGGFCTDCSGVLAELHR